MSGEDVFGCCDACLYWRRIGDTNTGECRIEPPRNYGKVNKWPKTQDHEWCAKGNWDDD